MSGRCSYGGGEVEREKRVEREESIEHAGEDWPVFDIVRVPGEHPTQRKIRLHTTLHQKGVYLL